MSDPTHSAHSRGGASVALLAATVAAMTTAVVLLSSASAQPSAVRTLNFRELTKGATLTHVHNTPAKGRNSNPQGDLAIFTNPLRDSAGRRAGTLHAQCVTTVGAQDFLKSTLTCTAVMHLHDGDLMLQLDNRPGAATNTGAVTGGTRAYSNAHGTIVSRSSQAGSTDTITLSG